MQQSNKKYDHPLAEKTLLQQKPVEIFAIKLGALLTVELHFGIMFFAIAIILINLLAQYLLVLCKNLSHSNSYAN